MSFEVDKSIADSTRAGFGRGLVAAARADSQIIALAADLRDSVGFSDFAKTFPDRFVEVGIAEQNLATLASGMAHVGAIPFAASYAAFSPGRNYEQIRTTIALNNQNVKIIGSHAGLNVGPDGATHQMLEDIALMRVLPRMVVIAPGDAREAEQVAQVIAQDSRPTYVRLAREKTPIFLDQNHDFQIGKAYILREGNDITLAATGTMTAQCLLAAEILAKNNISAEVVHCPTIKPLDTKTLKNSVAKTRHIISVEEHQVAGGFGGAVAEILAEDAREIDALSRQVFAKTATETLDFVRLGIRDEFGQSGTAEELLEHYHLTPEYIARTAELSLYRRGARKKTSGGSNVKILYAAYGADRDPAMMEHIIGAKVKPLFDGRTCLIKNYELCVQNYEQMPEVRFNGSEYRMKSNFRADWGGGAADFLTYIIRYKHGARTAARLYELTPEQHANVRDWEDWFKPILCEVEAPDGETLLANAESLWEDQDASSVADFAKKYSARFSGAQNGELSGEFSGEISSENYPDYIIDPAEIWRIADLTREGDE